MRSAGVRLVLAGVVALSLAGCGSSGGGSTLFDGFVPTGGSALVFAPATCDLPFVGSAALAGIMLDFTSYPDSCEVMEATSLCGNKASATRVLALVLSGEVGAAAIDPAGPATGAFRASTAQAVQDDAACEPLPGTTALDMAGGSVTLTGVSGARVSGSASIRFENGERFEHDFDLPLCAVPLDLCARFEPCTHRVCVP